MVRGRGAGMDLTQIRYFLALAKSLNFTRAAEACHVTQPALTKSIQKLEDELGGPLLLRERGNSQLTELGRTMVPLLTRTFEAATAARQGAAQFHRQGSAPLRIGIGAWVPPCSTVPLIRALHPRFPTLELSVRQGGMAALNEWLIGSEIDVAFVVDAEGLTDRANSWPLFGDEMVAVLPSGHSLDDRASLPRAALEAHPMVGRIDAEAAPAPGFKAFRHLAATEEHVWPLVQSGLGVALSTARRGVPGPLVCKPFDPACRLEVRIAAMPGRPAAAAADALLKLARARDWGVA